MHMAYVHCINIQSIDIVGTISAMHEQEQSGAAEACWAHNPEVDGSKPSSATLSLLTTHVFSVAALTHHNINLLSGLSDAKLHTA